MNDIASSPVALCLHGDSLNELFGFGLGSKDPTYHAVLDRFLAVADRHGMRFSIYVIGKDLDDPDVYSRVRDLASAGHEIGNHTWSHPINLAALPAARIKEEIDRTHEKITGCTGHEPVGFVAPGWSSSQTVIGHLLHRGYRYDASVIPSVFMYAIVLKVLMNNLMCGNFRMDNMKRRDWLAPFFRSTRPFMLDKDGKICDRSQARLTVLPLPALGKFSLPLWHTIYFVMGERYTLRSLQRFLDRYLWFSYVFHPADAAGSADIPLTGRTTMERLAGNIPDKVKALELVLEKIARSGRPVMTMNKMVEEYLRFA